MDIQSKKKIAKQYDELVEKHGFSRQSLYGDKAKYDKATYEAPNYLNRHHVEQ